MRVINDCESKTATIILDVNIDPSYALEYKNVLDVLLAKSYDYIIVDFSEVESMDKLLVGFSLVTQKKLKEGGGELYFKNVNNRHIKKTFDMLRLSKVIKMKY